MHLDWFPQCRPSQSLICAKSIGWTLPLPARSLWIYNHCCDKQLRNTLFEILFKLCCSLILVLILTSS